MVELGSVEAAIACHGSPAYRAALKVLDNAAERNIRMFEGLGPGSIVMKDRNKRASWLWSAAVGLAVAGFAVGAARADVIDGDWCRADGRTMSIRGPDIVTPGGKTARGDYTRHSFVYVIPAGEAGEGETVSMILRNEYLVHARQGGADAPLQEWRRCPPKVS
jgi:hypothetical protein